MLAACFCIYVKIGWWLQIGSTPCNFSALEIQGFAMRNGRKRCLSKCSLVKSFMHDEAS